ncbi:TlpA family protein disulfide reductase [Arthrobacter sp. TmT3-37]|uniref:TlpA family protein disulfide reductase n=1 Tax=Arthrobacter sp. B1805 TaxID=2058892 RepID=UPI000CE50A4C|nr:TlpA disulfide reductase family protein [Arthrobacter sp. B1805]
MAPGSSRPRSRASTLVALLATATLLITGCSAQNNSLAEQANAGDNKNYIAGDGSVAEYAPGTRSEPVDVMGELYDGTTVDSSQWVGDVVVLNVWYAACAPCRVEAPMLQTLSSSFAPEGVRFYGINVRDEKSTAEAFERNFGITYPSFVDRDGKLLLSLTSYVPPQAVPTTLVLDRQGRVSARILGVADESTLKTLIADALAEDGPAAPPNPSTTAGTDDAS